MGGRRRTNNKGAAGPSGDEPDVADRSFLDSVIDSIADPVFVKDAEHRWVALNRAMEELVGVGREELLGKSDFEFFPAEEARVFWEKDSLVFETGEVNVNQERFTDAQGRTHVISTKKQRFFDAAGRPHLVGVIRDITEQKRVEEALVRARDAAEAAARAKAAFLANVSHELRTPLNAVLGMTSLLCDSALDKEQRQYAEVIRDSGQDLLTLINDLLDLVKAEEGKVVLEERPFDLRRCLDRSVALLSARARQQGLALAVDIAPGVPAVVVGDSTRVQQVLVNLLSNAVKFTDRGRIDLRVRLRDEPPDDLDGRFRLVLEVADTGIGFPMEQREVLFEPFTQGDASTTRRFGGSGLGLAIVKRLALAMGGSIEVEAEAGGGSTFRFLFEARAAELPAELGGEEDEEEERARVPIAAEHPLRVLVAEDNPVSREVARLLLRRLGYEADVVADGAGACAALEQRPYDVVLMDVQMPGMDGLEAVRRIRAELPAGRQPWVVAVSASATAADIAECLAAGMDAHLAKPVEPRALRSLLLGAVRVDDEL